MRASVFLYVAAACLFNPVVKGTSVCPNDGIPDMLDGQPRTCSSESVCIGASYSCQGGYCCPVAVKRPGGSGTFPQMLGCLGGLSPEMRDNQVVYCSETTQCGSTYSCQSGVCCPQSSNTGPGQCPDGAIPVEKDGQIIQCTETAQCSGTLSSCLNGVCCPNRFVSSFPSCPNNGIPLTSDGQAKQCSVTSNCGNSAYSCQNGYCCPVHIESQKCPNNGIPLTSDGQAKQCSVTSNCGNSAYSCQNDYCCPVHIESQKCPNNGIPLTSDGQAKQCSVTSNCGNSAYSCQNGYCCPVHIESQKCPNNGIPLISDGQAKQCSITNDCGNSAFSCQNGYCCPVHIESQKCPNNGIPLISDGQAKQCSVTSDCGNTAFSCQNGYCCPVHIESQKCPNNGIPLISDGQAKQCSVTSNCGNNAYSCQNGYCCPVHIESQKCPNNGIPLISDGQAKQCSVTNDCGNSAFSCQNGYCCPDHIESQKCPNNGIPLMSDGKSKQCSVTSDCGNNAYSCQNDYCCPVHIAVSKCPNNGIAKMQDGIEVTCSMDSTCGSNTYSCQNGYCCPTYIVSTICPNNGIPDMSDNSPVQCSASLPCRGGAYSCQNGYCCPNKVVKQLCANNGIPDIEDGLAVTCNSTGQCKSAAYYCENGHCCPNKVYTGFCPNGGIPDSQDGMSVRCLDNSHCVGVGYSCQNNYCCPSKVMTQNCPNGGTPDVQDGQIVTCSSTKKCSAGSYSCHKGICCPAKLFYGVCPQGGQPDHSDGVAVTCSDQKLCRGAYSCQHGYCCPAKVYTEFCPMNGQPDVRDGQVMKCNRTIDCNSASYSCQGGVCCPARVFNGCPNGGLPDVSDGEAVKCSINVPCSGASYSCQNNYCCPVKLYTGYCPMNGIPDVTDGNKRRRCNANSRCIGPYGCMNGYCCPVKYNTLGNVVGYCPLNGIAEMTNHKVLKRCDHDNTCGSQYSCMNGYCCPVPINNQGTCPMNGIPMKDTEGQIKKCDETSGCGSSTYKCMNSLCCPVYINRKGETIGFCPMNGIPDMTDNRPRRCNATSGCRGLYKCFGGFCCPTYINSDGSKMGRCPVPSGDVSTCNNTNVCNASDSKCPGFEKCCKNICGGLVCMKPQNTSTLAPKPGLCPKPNGTGICVQLCSNDINCMGAQKCCSNGCGHTCQQPVDMLCKDGSPTVMCFARPCDVKKCPNFPNATCVDDYCGGCYARFYNKDKLEVTEKCGFVPQSNTSVIKIKDGICPNISSKVGTCVHDCNTDNDCAELQKCCSNGCGSTCVFPKFEKCNGLVKPLAYQNGTELFCGMSINRVDCPKGYFCDVEPGDHFAACCTKMLPVIGPGSTQVVASINNRALLSCEANGLPTPTVQWMKNDRPLSFISMRHHFTPNGSLVIYPVLETDVGRYKCFVSNSEGNRTREINLEVKPNGKCPERSMVSDCYNKDRWFKKCKSDSDCGPEMLCCNLGCGPVCTIPDTKTKCQKERDEAKMKLIHALLKNDTCTPVHIPRCNDHGNYSKIQCNDQMGVCWCSHDNGTKINQTELRGNLDCSKAAKPGICPSVQELQNGNVVCPADDQQCKSDLNCTGTMKCCANGCANVCMEPSALAANGTSDSYQREEKVCPDGSSPQCCDMSLCLRHKCPSNPSAVCRVNPCKGCKVMFFDHLNNIVNCTQGLTKCQLLRARGMMSSPYYTNITNMADNMMDHIENETKGAQGMNAQMARGGTNMTMEYDKDEDKDVCSRPAKTGKCKAYLPRYFYNVTSKQCEKFIFGGCESNGNNFVTLEKCQSVCGIVDRCKHKPEYGGCSNKEMKFFFNVTSRKCEKFSYSGCGGNDNRFSTVIECFTTCRKTAIDMPEGPFVPNCTTTGDFTEKQCHGAMCFCMNKTGYFMSGTVRIGHAICNDTELAMAGGAQKCPNGNSPKPCLHQCMNSTCPANPQATCFADPCNNCKVTFKDKYQNPVTCEKMNPCKLGKPIMTKKYSKYGCSNMQMRYYYDQQTGTCKKFSISHCEKDNEFFKSLYKCQSECTGSVCSGKGPKMCLDATGECSRQKCRGNPTAECQIDPCTCKAVFIDVATGDQADCNKIAPLCVIRRSNESKYLTEDNEMDSMGGNTSPLPNGGDDDDKTAQTSDEDDQDILPPQCDEHGKFVKQQCDGRGHCWCVDGRGTQIGEKKKVDDMNQDIGCAENKTESINFTMKFDIPQSKVKKNPQKFKENVLNKILKKVPDLKDNIDEIKIRFGSVYVDLTLKDTDDGDVVAKGEYLKSVIEMGDLDVQHEGENFTADPTFVTQSFVFEAQTQVTPKPTPEPPISKPEPGPHKDTMIIIIVVVVGVVAVALIIAVVVIMKRRNASTKGYLQDIDEPYSGTSKSDGTYFDNPSCDVK